jgi:hypothetical protein
MEFFDTAYIWLAPLLIIISFFIKDDRKKIALNSLAVINVLLIFHSIFVIRQFYAFIQMALEMNVKPDPNQKLEIGWSEIKLWLTILLPFFFLIKRISANRILSLFMLFLLVNDWFKLYLISLKSNWSIFESHNFYVYNISLKLMHYTSWVIFIYALFWFVKKLPSQRKLQTKN